MVSADGTNWAIVYEETSNGGSRWETLEVEEKPSSVATTV